MKHSLAVALIATLALSAPAFAQPVVMKEEVAGMLKLATIAPDAATTTALARVPNGKVQSAHIEKEDGKLIYSFDIKVVGKSGIEEVAVDAKTGKVLTVEHETPAQEAAEEKADKAKAAKTAAPAATTPPVRKPPARA